MALTVTTPGAIRDAVVTAIEQDLNVDFADDSDQTWLYIEGQTAKGGVRTFVVINDMESHRWAEAGRALMGGAGTSWVYDMHILVSYSHMERDDYEDMSASDQGALWELFHPRTSGNGTLTLGDAVVFGEETGILAQIDTPPEEGGPVVDFIVPVHYMREHDRNG